MTRTRAPAARVGHRPLAWLLQSVVPVPPSSRAVAPPQPRADSDSLEFDGRRRCSGSRRRSRTAAPVAGDRADSEVRPAEKRLETDCKRTPKLSPPENDQDQQWISRRKREEGAPALTMCSSFVAVAVWPQEAQLSTCDRAASAARVQKTRAACTARAGPVPAPVSSSPSSPEPHPRHGPSTPAFPSPATPQSESPHTPVTTIRPSRSTAAAGGPT
jgi:hypothetical protein